MVKCRSGNHEWIRQEDAYKCCSGEYRRILVIGNTGECDRVINNSLPAGISYGYKWEKI